jgi:glutathione S-transferase
MITLYQFATSPFCEKIRRILAYKQIAHEIHEVPRVKVAEYSRVSPTWKFPAIDHDGRAVWDSTDIAHYLDEAFPERPLIPKDPVQSALVHVLEDWADESLYFYEMTMRIAWEHNLKKKLVHEFVATMPGMTVEAALPMLGKAVHGVIDPQGIGRKPAEQVIRDAERHCAAIDGFLAGGRSYLVGEQLTLADVAVACQVKALLYAEEVVAIVARLPRVAAWIGRVYAEAPDSMGSAAGAA